VSIDLPVLVEEVVLFEEFAPISDGIVSVLDDDLVNDCGRLAELASHDSLGRMHDVVRRTHGRICRRDDGHNVRAVSGVDLVNGKNDWISTSGTEKMARPRRPHLGVPDLELHARRTIVNFFKNDGLRPLPSGENGEESSDDTGS
jgi:hypothetical protein